MDVKNINRFRFGGFVGACIAAYFAFASGDYATAGGLISAALSAAGAKAN